MSSALESILEKKTGVVFSSGFFGFFAHAGFLAALCDLGLKPSGYAGSSSGAIIAAMGASGLGSERIKDALFSIKKEDIWDPESWIQTALASLRLFRGWQGKLRGEKIRDLLARLLPVKRIEDTPIPCVVTGANLTERKEEIFSEGELADAVHASFAVPWLFKFKNFRNNLYVDGGIIDKAPIVHLAGRISPEVIIVHYLTSNEIRSRGNQMLHKRFTPQLANRCALNIGRHENYLLQKRFLKGRGIKVIELTPDVPPVHPSKMENGRAAYQAAYDHCISHFQPKQVRP